MSNPTTPISSPQFVNSTPDWVKPIIQKASQTYNIPTIILSALLKQESGFSPSAVSPVGAVGIAQFMPATAKAMGVNPNDPTSAIMGAARYLNNSYQKYGKMDLALAAYNAGDGAVSMYGNKIPPYKETQNYVKSIMALAGEPHASYNQPNLEMVKQASKQSNPPGIKYTSPTKEVSYLPVPPQATSPNYPQSVPSSPAPAQVSYQQSPSFNPMGADTSSNPRLLTKRKAYFPSTYQDELGQSVPANDI